MAVCYLGARSEHDSVCGKPQATSGHRIDGHAIADAPEGQFLRLGIHPARCKEPGRVRVTDDRLGGEDAVSR